MRLRFAWAVAAIVLLSWRGSVGAKITFDENGVLQIDGRKTFVVSFGMPPPAAGKTPEGKDALAELHEAGANYMRIAPTVGDEPQTATALARYQAWLDDAATHGMLCWITLNKLPAFKQGEAGKEQTLREIINRFRDHPGLGGWKAYDEAAWVKMPADAVKRAYDIFHELDPNHPVILIQAPTKGSLPLEPYMSACDVTGVDIYPIAYPPGKHSDFGNREISIVSDCTQWVTKAAQGKPVWMTLQIAWGGTATPKKTLRFPTFPESRYMAYAAIINGARGINYQGGALPLSLNERDSKLGWNWTHWKRVMKPLVEELGEKSPIHAALVAANSRLPIKVSGAGVVEFCAREVGDDLFIFAAKREGDTVKVKFTGLGATAQDEASVLFEEPRTVDVEKGGFTDWFGPNEVHVYRVKVRNR